MKNLNINNLVFIFKYYNAVLRLRFKLLILLLSVSLLFEMFGLASVVTIIDDHFSLGKEINVSDIWIAKSLGISKVSGLSVASMILGLFSLKGLFLYLALVYSGRLRSELLDGLRSKIFNNIVKISSAEISTIQKGNLLNVISEQAGKFVACFHSLVFFIIKLFSVSIYLLVIFWANHVIAFLALMTTLVLFYLFRNNANKISMASINLSQKSSMLVNVTGLVYDNLLDLKLGNREENHRKKFSDYSIAIKNNFFQIARLNAITQSLIEPIGLLLAGFIFFSSTVILDSEIAETLIVCGLLYRCSTQALGAQKNLQGCLESFGSVKIINDLEGDLRKILEQDFQLANVRAKHHISLENVSLTLDGMCIMHDVSIAVKQSEFIALIGVSGSGKSSALRVLCGLYCQTSGNYILDGNCLSYAEVQSHRSNFALLTSHSTLNTGSLIEQITDYKYSSWKSIPEHEKNFIKYNLKLLNVLDFIDVKDLELDNISDVNLESYSNGQVQRLNLVRAIISRPKVLFLDEATNGLDFELEYKTYKALRLIEGLSVVAVTHHTAVLSCFDKVFKFKNGVATSRSIQNSRKK